MTDPHADQPVLEAGTDLESAGAAVVLVHGRGATARSILDLGRQVHAEGVALIAPQAAGNEWYPNSFLAPLESNEPGLSAGLGRIRTSIERVTDAGIGRDQTMLVGFSQGACLATEFVARNPARYGGLAALSGGLIGPPESSFAYDGDLAGTPAFLGCSDVDPHIPVDRVHETAAVLEDLGAAVTERIYEGMAHTVNDDELEYVRGMVADL
jgi:phospholipase/carboxylesterase